MGNLNPKKKNLYKGRCLWPGRMWSFNILLSDTFSEFLQQNEHFNGLLPTIIRIFWIVFKSFYLTRKYSQIHICIYKYVLISNDLICTISHWENILWRKDPRSNHFGINCYWQVSWLCPPYMSGWSDTWW